MPVDNASTATRALARTSALVVVFGGVLAVMWWFGASAASAEEAAPETAGVAAVPVPDKPLAHSYVPGTQVDPAGSVASVTEPVTEAINALVLPVVAAADPIIEPTLLATAPVVEPLTGLLQPAVQDIAPDALVPLRAIVAADDIEAPAPPVPPIPPVVPEALLPAAVPDAPAPSVGQRADHGSPVTSADQGNLALGNQTTNAPSATWPAGSLPDRAPAAAPPASTASPSTTTGRDLPDRTHQAMADAMALAHSAIPAAVAPAGIGVVGASENSGSRPSVTPD